SGRRGAPPVHRPWGPGPWGGAPYGRAPGAQGPESPFEVLDRRLATGEIDVDTYRQLRAALLESRGGQP
ncbi:MAG: hypothetical protein J0I87_01675, partial [Cellulomonas sp.]|nr:hypothetical protein [Cellulomonas sp.]